MQPHYTHERINLETDSWIRKGLEYDERGASCAMLRCPCQIDGKLRLCKAGRATAVLASCHVRLLKALMPVHEDNPSMVSSLLGGISLNGGWRSFLETEDDTYVLAHALLVYLQTYAPGFKLDAHIASSVCTILNEWLVPALPWEGLPGAAELARRLVGETWCSLALPDKLDQIVSHRECAGDLLAEQRPPFLPGLCPAQSIVEAELLPEGFSS